MIHVARGDWRLEGCKDTDIDVKPLYKVAKHRNMTPVYVDVALIAHRPLDNIKSTDSRYIEADPTQPVLLVDGLENPLNLRYRMIDGRHRLLKLLEQKRHIIPAYVFSRSDFFKYCKVTRDVSAA